MTTHGNNTKGPPTARAVLSRGLFLLAFATCLLAAVTMTADDTNAFPDLNEVLQGRVFPSNFARDVFFLQQIRQRYAAHWPSLLAANITVGNYVVDSEKLRRFVEEVGAAGENSDDPIACGSLAAVITNAEFYTNVSRPEIQQAVAASLIKIGPKGRAALADAFTQTRYRIDPSSLEVLADAIGKSGEADSNISMALAATAFTFTAANGGSYPRCTEEAVRNLLCLTNGVEVIRSHLNTNEVFGDPGRFQSVVDGIADVGTRASSLATNLDDIAVAVKIRLTRLVQGPDPYRDDMTDLQKRIQKTIENLRSPSK